MTAAEPRGRGPAATYRVQLREGVGFARVRRLLPYLERLGITDLYLSPPFAAAPGSAHGYDVVDPTRMDPALGGRRAFAALAQELRSRRMGLVLDIVPNHMAATTANPWWRDVLRRGRGSPFARFFDIDWNAPDAGGKLVLPVLERALRELLADGACAIEEEGRIPILACGRLRLPLSPATERMVLERGAAWWNEDRTSAERVRDFRRLIEMQAYRLVWWREGNDRINYRRFFDIAGLAGLREEEPRAFARVHAAVARLVRDGLVTGLRVDHVDGLLDPEGYLTRLRSTTRVPFLVVEKILAPDERVPVSWPVDGSTGYGLLNDLGDLFVDPEGWRRLGEAAGRLRGAPLQPFEDTALIARRRVLEELFRSEVAALIRRLERLARRSGLALDADALRDALVEVTASLDVYRTYVGSDGVGPEDRRRIERAVRRARALVPVSARDALRFLRRVLLLRLPASAPVRTRSAWVEFVRHWQQLTGPVAAKGIEDTALYRDIRLVSRNEVGGDPGAQPLDVAGFHHRMSRPREGSRPLIPTSTHDTKRGEDVRARLAVLSEMPQVWETYVARWMRRNRRLRGRASGRPVPDPDEELLLYQTLLGAWPDDGDLVGFAERIGAYVVKAAREARVRTDWLNPDLEHETSLRGFAAAAVADAPSRRDLMRLQRTVAYHGALNSLSQAVLRAVLPGVADVYNGAETWDLSLVDPDNRRPLDFDELRRRLAELDRREARDRLGLVRELLDSWPDDRIKLYVVSRSLRLRRRASDVVVDGSYLPLTPSGRHARHVVAVARRAGGRWVMAVVPRLTLRLMGPQRLPVGARWGDTALRLPRNAPRRWRDVFTGERSEATGSGRLELGDLLGRFPAALLEPEEW